MSRQVLLVNQSLDHSTVITAIRKVNYIYGIDGLPSDRIKKLEKILKVKPGLVLIQADAKHAKGGKHRPRKVHGSFGLKGA